jgi:hypothetical protein
MKPLLFGKKKNSFGHINSKAGRNYYPEDIEHYEEIEIIREVTKNDESELY